jgi:hypothetical protein
MRRLLVAAATLLTPLSAHALSCASPCTSGTLTQTGSYCDIFVDCTTGAYSAATGTAHPAGPFQNVIYGGSSQSAGTSSLGLYIHGTGEHFSSGNEATATNIVPNGSCTYDPADTPEEFGNLGIETEWTVTDSNGNQYTWRHEVVTFGDSATNAGARLTQSLTALSQPADVGFRWQIDYQSAIDDGPTWSNVQCDPYSVSAPIALETEFPSSSLLDFYRIVNNDGFTPVEIFTSTVNLGGFPDTGTPDRLIYGAWFSLSGAGWNYAPIAQSADFDSAVLYYYGYSFPFDSVLAPLNTETRRSIVLFNGIDTDDCGEFEPIDTGDPPEPVDTAPPDTDTPVEPPGLTSIYAGGCASCNNTGGVPLSAGWLLLTLPLLRRRGR